MVKNKNKDNEKERFERYYDLAHMRLDDFGNADRTLKKESQKIQKLQGQLEFSPSSLAP